jgi:hypothetical protein
MSPITLRRWHAYIGSFIAPSVLFFTLTGAVQLFSLHEAHGSYHPPIVLERLSSLHKDQVLNKHEAGEKHEKAEEAEDSRPAAGADAGPVSHESHEEEAARPATFALKVFFLVVATGLTVSTCFGIWMSLQTTRKGLPLTLLAGGTLLPIILLLI